MRVSTSLKADAYVEEALRWLPESPGETRRGIEAPPAAHDGASTPKEKLIIVDDNADMRSYLGRMLGSLWDIEAVANGRLALEAMRKLKPDLVITDVMMPELDGFGMLQVIRDDPNLRDLPVIMLSARAGEAARVEGLHAGADDY